VTDAEDEAKSDRYTSCKKLLTVSYADSVFVCCLRVLTLPNVVSGQTVNECTGLIRLTAMCTESHHGQGVWAARGEESVL